MLQSLPWPSGCASPARYKRKSLVNLKPGPGRAIISRVTFLAEKPHYASSTLIEHT